MKVVAGVGFAVVLTAFLVAMAIPKSFHELPVEVTPTAPAPDISIWHWSNSRIVTETERAQLTALPVAAFMQWTGSIDLVNGMPKWNSRGGSVRGMDSIPRWSVIRIEVRCLPLLGTQDVEKLVDLVIQKIPPTSVGLQIDCDSPIRLLPAYGKFLMSVRQRLPSTVGLSCTGLLSWLSSPELGKTLAAVDWWVPQCYSTSVPKDPAKAIRLAGGGDVTRAVARCEALQKPYRIGLPTFEQVTWWNPDRTLRNAAVSISLEELLAAGLVPVVQPASEERIMRFEIPTDITVGSLRLLAGSTLLCGQPTVAGLASRLRAVRAAAGSYFRGVSLFRLPGIGDLPALSTAQLLAAEENISPATEITWRWSGGPGSWSLTLINSGVVDLVAITDPVGVMVDASAEVPSTMYAGGIQMFPSLDGEPVAPAHAREILIKIPFLRAGHEVILPLYSVMNQTTPSCRLRESKRIP